MIEDEVSDDEGKAAQRAERKRKRDQMARGGDKMEEGPDDKQIDSGSSNQIGSSQQVYQQIQMGIDMLLDSDEDDEDYGRKFADDNAMIEKDIDNWI